MCFADSATLPICNPASKVVAMCGQFQKLKVSKSLLLTSPCTMSAFSSSLPFLGGLCCHCPRSVGETPGADRHCSAPGNIFICTAFSSFRVTSSSKPPEVFYDERERERGRLRETSRARNPLIGEEEVEKAARREIQWIAQCSVIFPLVLNTFGLNYAMVIRRSRVNILVFGDLDDVHW